MCVCVVNLRVAEGEVSVSEVEKKRVKGKMVKEGQGKYKGSTQGTLTYEFEEIEGRDEKKQGGAGNGRTQRRYMKMIKGRPRELRKGVEKEVVDEVREREGSRRSKDKGQKKEAKGDNVDEERQKARNKNRV